MGKFNNLEGKIALVVGASSGIGKGIVMALAEKSPKGIVLVARRNLLLEKIANEIENTYNISPLIMQTDVTSEESLKKLIDTTIQTYGRIDIVVNSAGIIQQEQKIADTPLELTRLILHTNAIQALQLITLVSPYFEKQGSGIYITISSQAGTYAFYGEGAYCASKAAIDHGTRAIDNEFAKLREDKKEVYIFSIGPGFINTEEARSKFPKILESTWEKAQTPEQFGKLVTEYLIEPSKKYSQGGPVHLIETLRIDD